MNNNFPELSVCEPRSTRTDTLLCTVNQVYYIILQSNMYIHSGYRLWSLIPKPEIRIWEQDCLSVNVTVHVHVMHAEEATGLSQKPN